MGQVRSSRLRLGSEHQARSASLLRVVGEVPLRGHGDLEGPLQWQSDGMADRLQGWQLTADPV